MELTNEFDVKVPVEEAWAVLTDVERIAPCMPGAQLEEIEGDEYRGIVKVKVGPITAQYKGKARFIEKDEDAHRAMLRAEGRDTKGQGNASANITATLVPTADGTHVTVATDLTVTGRVAQFGRGVMADVSAKLLNQFVQCLEHDILVSPEQVASDIAAAGAAGSDAPGAAAGAAGSDAPGAAAGAAGSDGPGGVAAAGSETAGGETVAATGTIAAPAGAAAASSNGAGVTDPAPAVRKIEYKAAEPVDLLGTAGAPVAKRALPLIAVLFLLVWLLRRKRRG